MAPPNNEQVKAVLLQLANHLKRSVSAIAKGFQVDPFTYTVNFLPVTASSRTTGQFITQADSGFAIVSTIAVYTDTSNVFVGNLSDTPRVAPFLFIFSDSGSGRNLMDTQVHADAVFGTYRDPYFWSLPKILDPQSTFTIDIQNLSATDRNVRTYFHGYKIFGDMRAYRNER